MEVLVGLGILFCVILLWLNLLATLAIKYDHTLEIFQKIAQFIFVWMIPFFGAGIVLRLVYDHLPKAIPRGWIPWPFKNLIYGKPIKPNHNRGGVESDYISGNSPNSGFDAGGDNGGGSGGD
jgi:hypothetical protein